jgi:hypothetical protein
MVIAISPQLSRTVTVANNTETRDYIKGVAGSSHVIGPFPLRF